MIPDPGPKSAFPKRLGLLAGDPAGVGPEILAQALKRIPSVEGIEVLPPAGTHQPGRPTRASAQAAWDALEEAAKRLQSGHWQGVVTGPVCKHHLKEIGFSFPGQTEFFAARAGVSDMAMCLTGGALTVALVTAHIPLQQVPARLSTAEIVRVGRLLKNFLVFTGVPSPRIAVAGLNPHAGESGDLGNEEIQIIAPAVSELSTEGHFTGPWSPDTLFHQALEGHFDGVVCMYHDQGLIPLKMHAFHSGVNITLGLPFVRTSPDHGTAFDLAGRGKARPDSYLAAIRLALRCLGATS